MTIVADIVRRFSIALMLVAIVSLASQAGATYAYGDDGDCANDIHLSQLVDHGGESAVPSDPGDVGHVHKVPCKSACCHSACSMALLTDLATLQGPFFKAEVDLSSFVRGASGVDLEGLSRPPRTPLAV